MSLLESLRHNTILGGVKGLKPREQGQHMLTPTMGLGGFRILVPFPSLVLDVFCDVMSLDKVPEDMISSSASYLLDLNAMSLLLSRFECHVTFTF